VLRDIDIVALADYLRAAGVSGARAIDANLISGGRSNLTYRLDVDGETFILRRPPHGPTLATAHDMGREYRVMAALVDTEVPVPRMVAFCESDNILGAPFYLMENVDGSILRELSEVNEISVPHRKQLAYELIDVLAALHHVNPDAVGLADFGRPEGFMERQVRRWTRQLSASVEPTPAMRQLAHGLARAVPANSRHAIVHGDYRLDNCVTRDGCIAAVLDWEMSTLGDPISDLAMFALYYDGLADLPNTVVNSPGRLTGFPPLPLLLDRYAATTGADIHDFSWYQAFAWFKLAVILVGIEHRVTSGQTAGQHFAGVAALIDPSIDSGHALLKETLR
jgi:aminoglycoside phosphotransferase (APT) family kinase protein